MIRQSISTLMLGTLTAASGMVFSAPSQAVPPSPQVQLMAQASVNNAAVEKSVFDQINKYRASKGLKPLSRNANIDKQARIHSQNMASGKVPFSHQGFQARVKATKVSFQSAGENVAWNKGYSDAAKQAVDGWLKSPGHLANIKGNFNLTGIGVATSPDGKVYLTQIFLRQ